MNRSEKKDFVEKLKEELSSSSSVIVAHYSGITVDETDQLRKEMRNNGAKFKVTKNRLTKLALEDTQFKSLADLFSGPTAIAYSEDPVAPAKVAVSFEKKIENFKIIGGGDDGERMDNNKIGGTIEFDACNWMFNPNMNPATHLTWDAYYDLNPYYLSLEVYLQ